MENDRGKKKTKDLATKVRSDRHTLQYIDASQARCKMAAWF